MVRAEANKDNTTWIATKMVSTLNVLEHDLASCVLGGPRDSEAFPNTECSSVQRWLQNCVVPDLLHVIPVRHDNMLDGILLRQDTTLAPSLVTDVTIFLHADQNALHLGTADDG